MKHFTNRIKLFKNDKNGKLISNIISFDDVTVYLYS